MRVEFLGTVTPPAKVTVLPETFGPVATCSVSLEQAFLLDFTVIEIDRNLMSKLFGLVTETSSGCGAEPGKIQLAQFRGKGLSRRSSAYYC